MNKLLYKTNKLNSVLFLIILYILLLLLFLQSGSTISVLFYFFIFLMAIKKPSSIFALLGASNYISLFFGVSPIVFFCIEIMGIVFVKSFLNNNFKIKLFNVDILFVMLSLMLIWTFFTGKMQGDLSFFLNIFNYIIIYISVKLFFSNIQCSIGETLMFFMLGVGVGVLIGIAINLGIPGFVGNHPFRLAIGERSDPNSTGILMAILTVYLFIKAKESLVVDFSKFILMVIFLSLTIYTLILTQSRGSTLSVILVIIFYMIVSHGRINSKSIIRLATTIGIIIILIFIFRECFEDISKILDVFLKRFSGENSSDGARLYLILQGVESFINNPISGVSLENFRIISGHIPHNIFLDYLVTNGIVGAIFFIMSFCWPIVKMFKEFISNRKFSIYCCYIVCIINAMNYSASGEKIILVLLVFLTTEFERIKNKSRKITKGLNVV